MARSSDKLTTATSTGRLFGSRGERRDGRISTRTSLAGIKEMADQHRAQ